MNQNDPFSTTCNCVGELFGILRAAETKQQVARLYYANEEIVSRDECLKQEFYNKRDEINNQTN